MAMELQVTIALVNTDPAVEQPDGSQLPAPGSPGILIRTQRATTLVDEADTTVEGAMRVARHRLEQMVHDCHVDADAQIEIVEGNAAAAGQ